MFSASRQIATQQYRSRSGTCITSFAPTIQARSHTTSRLSSRSFQGVRLQNKGFVVCTTAFRVHPKRKDALQSDRPKPQRHTAPAWSDVARRTMSVAVTTFLRATKRFSRASKRIPVVMQSSERLLTMFCPCWSTTFCFIWSSIPVDAAVPRVTQYGAHRKLHWKCTSALQKAE